MSGNIPTTSLRRGSNNYKRVPTSTFDIGSETDSVRQLPDGAPSGELAGIYLGILNLYTTLPQFVGTGISMVVFTILEPGKSPELAKDAHPDEHHSTDGPNAIGVMLFIGAICSCGAAYATRRLRYVV